MPTLNMFIPLTKVDAVQRLVYGSLANETVDKTGEIFDYASSKKYVEEWSGEIAKATDGKSMGNLRAMHGKVAAGKFVSLLCNDATASIDVCAKVVDDAEWQKVAEGVYTGFSIGGEYIKKWPDPNGGTRYTARPSEGSLVDNPANPGSHFQMVKADGVEEKTFAASKTDPIAPAAPAAPGPDTPELEQVWKAKDGATFATKALAKAHNDELAKAAASAADPSAQLQAAIDAAKAVVASADAAVAKREFSQEERDKAADAGEAMSDGSFPIKSVEDLKNAIQAYGRAKDKTKVKAHIIARAKALGAEGELPDAWKPGADKALVALELRKGMYGVARLAALIEELEWLQQDQEWEEAAEGDTESKLPVALKEAVTNLCAILGEMVHEEGGELLSPDEMFEMGERLEMALSVKGGHALAKAVAKTHPQLLAKASEGQSHALEQAHGHMAKAGANCPHPPADDWRGDGDGADEEKFYKAVPADLTKGARHSGETQAHLDTAHGHLDELGKCSKAHSGAEQVHLDAAHDHMAKLGVGCGATKEAAAGGVLGKAGAKHSAADLHHFTKAHDRLVEAGAACPMAKSITDSAEEMAQEDTTERHEAASAKAAPAGELEKVQAENASMRKDIDSARASILELTAYVKKLSEQPVARPHERQSGPYRVVSKGEEDTSEQLNAAFEKMSPAEKADFAIRFIHRNGPVPFGAPRG